jgi:hypothetical protein
MHGRHARTGPTMEKNNRNSIGIATFFNIQNMTITGIYPMSGKWGYRRKKTIKLI